MILRKDKTPSDKGSQWRAKEYGPFESLQYSIAGGLTQFGAYVETLQPGSRSSERHWHEQEDEFLYIIAGEATVIEEDGPHILYPGDAACWPAGAPNAHCVLNRSDAPCTYMIVGTRVTRDICHYPDAKKVLHTEGDTWRLVDHEGKVLKSGTIPP